MHSRIEEREREKERARPRLFISLLVLPPSIMIAFTKGIVLMLILLCQVSSGLEQTNREDVSVGGTSSTAAMSKSKASAGTSVADNQDKNADTAPLDLFRPEKGRRLQTTLDNCVAACNIIKKKKQLECKRKHKIKGPKTRRKRQICLVNALVVKNNCILSRECANVSFCTRDCKEENYNKCIRRCKRIKKTLPQLVCKRDCCK